MFIYRQARIVALESGMFLVVEADLGRWVVVRLAPQLHLVGAVLLGSLLLAKSLKGAVVALVEFPRFVVVDLVGEPQLVKNQVAGFDGAIKL